VIGGDVLILMKLGGFDGRVDGEELVVGKLDDWIDGPKL